MLKCLDTMASKHTWAAEQTKGLVLATKERDTPASHRRSAVTSAFFLLKIKNKIKNLSSGAGGLGVYNVIKTNT